VYASSSASTPKKYLDAAVKLGNLLGEGGHTCVNGGGKFGGMGALNVACKGAGATVVCVIHERWVLDLSEFKEADELIVVTGDDLAERKSKLLEGADAIVALPGGLGTFDEVCDVACQKQLGMNCDKIPVCLLNIDGFFDGFMAQLKRAKKDGLLHQKDLDDIIHAEGSEAACLTWCHTKHEARVKEERETAATEREAAATLEAEAVGKITLMGTLKRSLLLPPICALYTWMFMQTIYIFMYLSGETRNMI